MKDIILIDSGRGRVELVVQTKDGEAHSRLSDQKDAWLQARLGIQHLVEGVLKEGTK